MICIVGGGIAGCMTALELSETHSIELYEKDSLLNNSHYCHLHFGLLYPESNVIEFTQDSLLFMKEFPDCIQYRPTIVCYSSNSIFDTNNLINDCKTIENFVTDGKFYKSYEYEDILNITLLSTELDSADYFDKYIKNTFTHMNKDILNRIKYPIVCAKEYGINQNLVKQNILERIKLNKNILVRNEEFVEKDKMNVIFATGHHNKLRVEKKASFILNVEQNIAEFAIIGERGTEDGLLQITPISSNECIVHKMSHRGSLGLFDQNYIISEFNRVFSFPVKNIQTNIGYQEVHDDLENRTSGIIRKNGIHIRLLKAISSVRISKSVKLMIDNLAENQHQNQK